MTPDAQRLLELARQRFAALRPTLPTDSHQWLEAQLLLHELASSMRRDHQRVAGMMRRPDGNVQPWSWLLAEDAILFLCRESNQIEAAAADDPRFEPGRHTLTFTYTP